MFVAYNRLGYGLGVQFVLGNQGGQLGSIAAVSSGGCDGCDNSLSIIDGAMVLISQLGGQAGGGAGERRFWIGGGKHRSIDPSARRLIQLLFLQLVSFSQSCQQFG